MRRGRKKGSKNKKRDVKLGDMPSIADLRAIVFEIESEYKASLLELRGELIGVLDKARKLRTQNKAKDNLIENL